MSKYELTLIWMYKGESGNLEICFHRAWRESKTDKPFVWYGKDKPITVSSLDRLYKLQESKQLKVISVIPSVHSLLVTYMPDRSA